MEGMVLINTEVRKIEIKERQDKRKKTVRLRVRERREREMVR